MLGFQHDQLWNSWNYFGILGIILEFLELFWNSWNSSGILGIILEFLEFFWNSWNYFGIPLNDI
jgi:hypothetical protein